MATFTRVTSKNVAPIENTFEPEKIVGAHTGKLIPRPNDPRINLECECKYSGQGDSIHTPCNGKWHPWTDFLPHKNRGLQDVCKNCSALRSRNWKRKNRLLSEAAIERDLQEKLGREMAEKESEAMYEHRDDFSKESKASDTETLKPRAEFVTNEESRSVLADGTSTAPTDEELQRVGTYLLSLPRQGELDLARATIIAIEADVTALEARLLALTQDSQAMLELATQQEREMVQLRIQLDALSNAMALQEEYQHKLVDAGIRIPARYKLFTSED